MRFLLILLALGAPALAAPTQGSWKLVRNGPDPKVRPYKANGIGNANQLDVLVGPLLTDVVGLAITDLLSKDQESVAQSEAEAWFTLAFCGDAAATEHRWEIVTKIHGMGSAMAGTNLVARAWAESVSVIKFTGDNEHTGTAHLAVDDTAGTRVTLGFPTGFRISSDRSVRSTEVDQFETSTTTTTRGGGKVCRVHSHAYAKAHISASCLILFGAATASVSSGLYGDLTMKGYCRVGTILVEDTYVAKVDYTDFKKHTEKAPTGGVETDQDDPPPDEVSEEERRDGLADEEEPVDAADLPGTTGTPNPDDGAPAPDDDSTPPEGGATTPEDGAAPPDGGATTPDDDESNAGEGEVPPPGGAVTPDPEARTSPFRQRLRKEDSRA